MADTPVKTGLLTRGLRWVKRTCTIIGMIVMLGVAGTVIAPSPSKAAMAVIDQSVLAQAIEEVKAAKQQLVAAFEQIKWLTDIFDTLNDTVKLIQNELDAIGRLGRIELPWVNLMKSSQNLRRDIACLIPDPKKWGVTFKDLNFRSICEGKNAYERILYVPRDKDDETIPWTERARLRKEAQERRRALFIQLSTEAMAAAHLTRENDLKEIPQGIDDLEDAGKRAEDMNGRLNVLVHALAMVNKQLANIQKMQAMQLQISTAHFVATGVPVSANAAPTPQNPAQSGGNGP
ncbi:hypothetical protein [Novispirillum itersonii]|uniref:Uncharacterized protein n=1 Tax=Novispirillum itersonii TaxID=189 RepID=A0A7X0DQ00_NOVIT|nr:hypothetical protein [Novispirillum itersonii]MBB6211802.1 hypothetical protein [Novispirillum itersonii]